MREGSRKPVARDLPPGNGEFKAKLDGVWLRIFTHRPARKPRGLLLVFHGNSRNAEDYRDFAIPLARAQGLVVVAPRFDARRFPARAYHRGGLADRFGVMQPASTWTTRFVPLLIEWARARIGRALPFWLWGFSAGGQFLSRVAACQPMERARRIVIASPSSHVLPTLEETPPYGFGGCEDGPARLCDYLGQPLSLYVGAADRKPGDRSLARSPAALRQGRNRVERTVNTYEMGQQVAQRLGQPFDWTLEMEPGVGHTARAIFTPREACRLLNLPPRGKR